MEFHAVSIFFPKVFLRWLKWLEREFTDRKVRGSNPTSASGLPLSRLGQPDTIPTLVVPSGGMAARHRKSATAERFFSSESGTTIEDGHCAHFARQTVGRNENNFEGRRSIVATRLADQVQSVHHTGYGVGFNGKNVYPTPCTKHESTASTQRTHNDSKHKSPTVTFGSPSPTTALAD
ncbi:hypothetical protein T265_00262 [Opisthorchis viverrini]|uniref:Uncharacterized protein n=1 Tax=Opisthorchis viverrini TaxID=6198 RepID=A0A075ADA7_OPIVI|nr:hypothetical protein T265_00262 [Opisthorchis viverrini]KER34090.1 hypothetical protein T265_00262 [Opisthorchis viverrini]